jgi:hypothetical protein
MAIAQSTRKHDAGRVPGPFQIPSVIEIVLGTQLTTTKMMFSKLHGSYTTAPANMLTLANALMSAFSSAWTTNLAPLMATTTIFQWVTVRDMSSSANLATQSTGASVAGTSASIAMPLGAAVVMTEDVNIRGRGSKGRIYLGGWATNADAAGGQITAATQTAVDNFGTAVLNALNTNSLTPALAQPPRANYMGVTGTVHPARGEAPNGTHATVTAYVCSNLRWDSQRRLGQP